MNSSANLSYMNNKNSYKYEELIDCADGKLFGPGNAKLPSPPMLMFDRITNIQNEKGKFNKGLIEAELDIKEKLWFFDCHFKEDPVMPGMSRFRCYVAVSWFLFRLGGRTRQRKGSRSEYCQIYRRST